MVAPLGPAEFDVTLRFGGGLNTRASEDEINQREAAAGQNFVLDLLNTELRSRSPFDLVGTLPNSASVQGGGSYRQADGTVKAFFQGGDTCYDWDGQSTFTSLATVDASSKLRGHWRSHAWILADKLLITDIALLEQVKEWDGGAAISDVSFTDEASAAFGDFFAKYLQVTEERATFYHVKDSSATTRHMAVGSKRDDYTQITVTNRPSTSLSDEDPFHLLVPDLRPINGVVDVFGTTIISTEDGALFDLQGLTGKTDSTIGAAFSIEDFYLGSNAVGDEAMTFIGNDILYGRRGRIESVRDTDRFGDSEADDLTIPISPDVENVTSWTLVYNARLNRVYAFPSGNSEVWTLQTALIGQETSPWTKWTTAQSLAFQPSFVMSMLDPSDSLEYVFMGDGSGNIYRMEGTGTSGDGGANSITTNFTSALFSADLGAQEFDIEGYIKYRQGEAATVTLTFLFAGENAFDRSLDISLPALSNRPVYGGNLYYNDSNYYGTPFSGRLRRKTFGPPGQGNEFQIKVETTGTAQVRINEIGLRGQAVKS